MLCGVGMAGMLVFAVPHLVASDSASLRRLELVALDLGMRLRGPLSPGPETVLVLIDDRTIAELGRWPLPRRKFGDAVRFLKDAGAKVIGIDVLFSEEDASSDGASGDGVFAAAVRKAGNVVLPFAFRFDQASPGAVSAPIAEAAFATVRPGAPFARTALRPTGILAPLPALAEAAAALGHASLAYDVDGAVRYDYPVVEYDLDYYPSMALRAAQLFRGTPWSEVSAELGSGVRLGDRLLPTDPAMRMLVNYLGPPGSFPTFPFAAVAAGSLAPELFRGRVVLIGSSITGITDTFHSPFSAVLPGVERLATVVDSILHDRPLRRPVYGRWLESLWMVGFSFVIGLALSRSPVTRASLVALVTLSVSLLAAQFALEGAGLWFAVAAPSLAAILTFTLLVALRYGLLDREHRRVRQAFQRYLAPAMVERLAQNPHPPELGGEQRELTVLFCDLRGFSGIAERLDAPALTRVINAFFATVTEAVLARGGTVDKYMGDAVMAFWNAPLDQPDHAVLACRAALDIIAGLSRLNARSDAMALACGIGINTGPCTVGNFGSHLRFDYSAVGDAVNIAARLESETKAFGLSIALGPETAARVPDMATLPLDLIRPRGREQTLELWTLLGDETAAQSAAFIALRQQHHDFRGAIAAADEDAAQTALDALQGLAPPALLAFYRHLSERLAKPRR